MEITNVRDAIEDAIYYLDRALVVLNKAHDETKSRQGVLPPGFTVIETNRK